MPLPDPLRIAWSLAHDDFYRRAQAILNKYNPCQFKGGRCLRGEPCCGMGEGKFCEHLGATGCTVSALYCKVWLCHTATQMSPACADELWKLQKEIDRYYPGMLQMRRSKAQVFDNLLYPEERFDEEATVPATVPPLHRRSTVTLTPVTRVRGSRGSHKARHSTTSSTQHSPSTVQGGD